jgi:hypothetical protein
MRYAAPIALLLLASPAQASNLDDFLRLPSGTQGSYLLGYIDGRVQEMVVNVRQASGEAPATTCGEMLPSEVAQLMLMSMRRTAKPTLEGATFEAFNRICGRR